MRKHCSATLADIESIYLEKPPEQAVAVGRFTLEIVPLNRATSHASAPISGAIAACGL